MSGYFRDEEFQESMLARLCRDRNFIKRVAGILSDDDFRPRGGEGSWEAYVIAQKAFEFWDKYREPIGGMLRHEMLDHIEQNKRKIGHKSRDKILDLVTSIRNAELIATEAIERKVIEYKQRQAMSHAIKDIIKLKEQGELTTHKFYKLVRDAVEERDHSIRVSMYGEEIDKRITRREREKHRRYPYLHIEQLDRTIRTFPKKNYGIILARYKTGKSTAAVYIDQVMALQNFNVLHFTLEDPKEDVEDKLDASFAGMKLKVLAEKPRKLRRRLRRHLERIKNRIRIVDGTDGGMTVARMEEIWERFRNQGFDAQVVVIDSDEMIEPLIHHKEQGGETRESKDIHKDIKKFMSRRELWGWVMAQTQRGKKGARQMIVTGDDSATDISKQRRCAMCIGVGDGPEEYGEDGRYIYIATHRYDRGKIGWPIVGDFERGIFYDKERTARAERRARHHHKED
jgi:hypothetical protein